MKITPNYKEIDVDVDFDYEPGDPGVHTYSNGDPGYPPTREVFEITSVKHNGIEIIDYLSDSILEEIEEKLRDEKADHAEARQLSRAEDRLNDRLMDNLNRRNEP